MHRKQVYLYVFDTMADWEVGYLIAELNSGRYFKKDLAPLGVVTVGVDKNPITTMGGVNILPSISIDECILKSTDVLVLPGGNTWTEAMHEPILKKSLSSFIRRYCCCSDLWCNSGACQQGLARRKKAYKQQSRLFENGLSSL